MNFKQEVMQPSFFHCAIHRLAAKEYKNNEPMQAWWITIFLWLKFKSQFYRRQKGLPGHSPGIPWLEATYVCCALIEKGLNLDSQLARHLDSLDCTSHPFGMCMLTVLI